jgi:hypothetical protein
MASGMRKLPVTLTWMRARSYGGLTPTARHLRDGARYPMARPNA